MCARHAEGGLDAAGLEEEFGLESARMGVVGVGRHTCRDRLRPCADARLAATNPSVSRRGRGMAVLRAIVVEVIVVVEDGVAVCE